MYLSPEQRRAVVATTLHAAGKRVPVVAGISAVSTRDAVEQAREYEKTGVGCLIVMRQKGFATSEAGVVGDFADFARAVFFSRALTGDELNCRASLENAEGEQAFKLSID